MDTSTTNHKYGVSPEVSISVLMIGVPHTGHTNQYNVDWTTKIRDNGLRIKMRKSFFFVCGTNLEVYYKNVFQFQRDILDTRNGDANVSTL